MQTAIAESDAAVDCNALPTVPANDMQLGQVLLYLLSNALKCRAEDRGPARRDAGRG